MESREKLLQIEQHLSRAVGWNSGVHHDELPIGGGRVQYVFQMMGISFIVRHAPAEGRRLTQRKNQPLVADVLWHLLAAKTLRIRVNVGTGEVRPQPVAPLHVADDVVPA